jgi:hypothetical protein
MLHHSKLAIRATIESHASAPGIRVSVRIIMVVRTGSCGINFLWLMAIGGLLATMAAPSLGFARGDDDTNQLLRKLDQGPLSAQETRTVVEEYRKMSPAQKDALKTRLRGRYHESIRNNSEDARQYRDLHRRLVSIASKGTPLKSVGFSVQQPAGPNTKYSRYDGDQDDLAEVSRKILETGTNTLKIALHKRHLPDPRTGRGLTLTQLAKRPYYREVLDLPFRYMLFWAHKAPGRWRDGLTGSQKQKVYYEMYDFASYLLKRYSGSGKTFLIGNWEGDWLLLGSGNSDATPDERRVQAMIDWFNIRQKAVEAARQNTPHEDVQVYHYVEFNRVSDALKKQKERVVNAVLPYTRVDYVSYSSYDTTNLKPWRNAARNKKKPYTARALRQSLYPALAYIRKHLPPKDIPGNRIIIGEFGYHLKAVKRHFENPREAQARLAATVASTAMQWGTPMVLWWQYHDNEKDGRRFGMVGPDGPRPIHELLSRYNDMAADSSRNSSDAPLEPRGRQAIANWLKSFGIK